MREGKHRIGERQPERAGHMAVNPDRTVERSAEYERGFVSLPKKQFILSMACVTLAMFLGALGQTIVATALPRIVADVGGLDRYVWVATAYMVAATVAMPITGGLSDLYGRKPLFIAGLIVFLAGSVLLGMIGSMNEIIAFRALQGLGGGVIVACSLATVADLSPPEQRGKYQGLLAGVYGIASVVGPVVGGFITDHYSWNGIFLFNAPVAFVILLSIVWVFPNADTGEADRTLDYPGTVLLVLALVPLLLALSFGGAQYDWDSPECLGLLTFGLAMAVVFVRVELRAENPIMPLGMYADRTVALAMATALLTGFALYGCLLFLPLFFQGVLGASAATSGNLLIPMLPAIVLGAILSGQLLSKAGAHYRRHVLCGTALATVGMYLISTMSKATDVILIEAYLVLTGLGLGATLATITVAVQNLVPFGQVGAATAANQFWRSVGGMIGLAVVGAVMTSSFSSKLEAIVSGDAAALLPQGWLESVKENPQELLDPTVGDSLRVGLEEAGPGSTHKVGEILDSLQGVLAGALSDVFAILVVASGLSFAAALMFRETADTESTRNA